MGRISNELMGAGAAVGGGGGGDVGNGGGEDRFGVEGGVLSFTSSSHDCSIEMLIEVEVKLFQTFSL